MPSIPFDNRITAERVNGQRREETTVRGVIEIWPEALPTLCTLEILGPAGAQRGLAMLSKADARAVAFALLQWAFVGKTGD